MKRLFCVGLIVQSVAYPWFALAQTPPQDDTLQSPSRGFSGYFLSTGMESQLLMKVNVWGEVTKPGIYQVSDQTDLISLISTAGGPTDAAQLAKVRLVRNYAQEQQVFKINLKRVMDGGRADTLPEIRPGDTVVIPKNKFSTFAKYLIVAYHLAVIATAVKIYVDK